MSYTGDCELIVCYPLFSSWLDLLGLGRGAYCGEEEPQMNGNLNVTGHFSVSANESGYKPRTAVCAAV